MAIKATVFNSALIQLVRLEQYSDSLELACIPIAFFMCCPVFASFVNSEIPAAKCLLQTLQKALHYLDLKNVASLALNFFFSHSFL